MKLLASAARQLPVLLGHLLLYCCCFGDKNNALAFSPLRLPVVQPRVVAVSRQQQQHPSSLTASLSPTQQDRPFFTGAPEREQQQPRRKRRRQDTPTHLVAPVGMSSCLDARQIACRLDATSRNLARPPDTLCTREPMAEATTRQACCR